MKKNLIASLGVLSGFGLSTTKSKHELLDISTKSQPISRSSNVEKMQNNSFDVVIIGGGVTGCGCALDASSRGLKTALIERFDFSSGTSSKSTKLLHGGVRYLEQAFKNLDYEKYKMCYESLHERSHLFTVAPHLANSMPIVIPVYSWWRIPYMYLGLKMYDQMAGDHLIKPSYVVGHKKCLELCPRVKKEGLKGAIVYYDGSHDDSRTTISIALTAANHFGLTLANYVSAIDLIFNSEGQVSGVRCKDNMTGREFDIRAKVVVNASGPYSDSIRRLSDPSDSFTPLCCPSMGVHITLPRHYANEFGMLKPNTSDGRLLFCLPWKDHVIAGTTDTQRPLSDSPPVLKEDVDFIINELSDLMDPSLGVSHNDILSVWSGYRPLVFDSSAPNTATLARNHVVEVDKHNLVTISGGKFTTFRQMAEDTIDKVVGVGSFPQMEACNTKKIPLVGADVAGSYSDVKTEAEKHLFSVYGLNYDDVLKLDKQERKLDPSLPYLESEVIYACRYEMAERAVDVIARRTRMSFLNKDVSSRVVDRVVELMAVEKGWDKKRILEEKSSAREWIGAEMSYGG